MAIRRVNADLVVAGEVTAAGDNLNQKIALLENLLPDPPLPLDGLEFEAGQVAGNVQVGGLALAAGAVYDFGMDAGDQGVPNVIHDATARLITINTDRFERADEGVMRLLINGTLKETLDLTQAVDAGGHLRIAGHALERIDIVAHNSFEPYKRGRMRIYLGVNGCTLRSGANRIRLEHQIDGATHGAGEIDLFYDNGVNAPQISTNAVDSVISASEPVTPVCLSGVRFIPAGSSLHIKATGLHIFETTFHAHPLTIRGGQAGFADQDIDYVAGGDAVRSGYSNPPNSADPFIVEKDINVAPGCFTMDARVTAVARDPFAVSAPVDIARQGNKKLLINSMLQQSTELIEKFTDEVYRLPLAEYLTIPGAISSQWTPANALSNGNAQAAGGLIFPNANYGTGFTPSTGQPNFSSFSGQQKYIRAFRDLNDPHNAGILKLVGLTLADLISAGNVKVELKLPGRTGWLDLGLPFDAGTFTGADGDGCRTAVNGDEFSWSVGTNSTALSGWMVIVRVTLKSPAAPTLWEMRMLGW